MSLQDVEHVTTVCVDMDMNALIENPQISLRDNTLYASLWEMWDTGARMQLIQVSVNCRAHAQLEKPLLEQCRTNGRKHGKAESLNSCTYGTK